MTKCHYGKLKSPVRERGRVRHCKLKKKSHMGRSSDRRRKSSEFHETRYRRDVRRGKR